MPLVVQELSFLLNNFIRKESLDAEKEEKRKGRNKLVHTYETDSHN